MIIPHSTHYKFRHLTRDSFPDLTPDDAFEIIDARERLEEELQREDPGSSVIIGKDLAGYHLIARPENSFEVNDRFNEWKVIAE